MDGKGQRDLYAAAFRKASPVTSSDLLSIEAINWELPGKSCAKRAGAELRSHREQQPLWSADVDSRGSGWCEPKISR